MSDQIREQISALMDGELPRDQTRFLLRRIEGDAELGQCWSRYQLASSILRREQVDIPADSAFTNAVMNKLSAAISERPAHGASRALRWVGGGAIAAAVAVVALVNTRLPESVRPAPMINVASAPVPTAAQMTMPNQAPIDLREPIATPLPMMSANYAQPASYDTALLPLSPYQAFGKTPIQRFSPYLLSRPATQQAVQPAASVRTSPTPSNN